MTSALVLIASSEMLQDEISLNQEVRCTRELYDLLVFLPLTLVFVGNAYLQSECVFVCCVTPVGKLYECVNPRLGLMSACC